MFSTIFFFFLQCICYRFIFFFNSVGYNAIFSYRIYVLPLILIYSLNKLEETIKWNRLVKLYIYNSLIMAIFSLIQQFFIGDWIYLIAGYPSNTFSDERLHASFYTGFGLLQRGTGGFTAPTAYSIYLATSLILLNKYYYIFRNEKKVRLFKTILFIGLVFTLTRSTIIGYIVIFMLPNMKLSLMKFLKYFIMMIMLLLLQYVFVKQDIKDIELATLTTFWNNISNLQDSSSAGHFNSLNEGIVMATENLSFGLGLGTVGPHTSAYLDNPIVIESTYLSIITELGFFTTICYLYSFLFTLGIRQKETKSMLLLYAGISFLLPIHYFLELSILFLIAISATNQNNKNVKKAKFVDQNFQIN